MSLTHAAEWMRRHIAEIGSMKGPPVRAVIFDFDGVLADTERPQIRAWLETTKRLGVTADETQVRLLSGHSDERIARELFRESDRVICKALQMKRYLTARVAPRPMPRPGAREVLSLLSQICLPAAIVSSTPAASIREALKTWMWPEHWFPCVVGCSGEMAPKPSPRLYHAAVKTLGARARHCVAVEDTLPGLEAASRAGCKTVGLAGTLGVDDLSGQADRVIEELGELVRVLNMA